MSESSHDKKKPSFSNIIGPLVCFILVLAFICCLVFGFMQKPKAVSLSYSDFLNAVKKNQVEAVTIIDNQYVFGTYAKGSERYGNFSTFIPYSPNLSFIPFTSETHLSNHTTISFQEIHLILSESCFFIVFGK